MSHSIRNAASRCTQRIIRLGGFMKMTQGSALIFGISIVGVLSTASLSSAQHVISVYTDAVASESTLFGVANTSDDTGDGCGHTYMTSASLSGPTGFARGWDFGFSHIETLSLGDGDFDASGGLTLLCGCGGGDGAGVSIGVSVTSTSYELTDDFPDICGYGTLACANNTQPSCNEAPLTIYPAVKPCALYRKARYLRISGVCYGIFSTGTSGPDVCT